MSDTATSTPVATIAQPDFEMNPKYDYIARYNPITGQWEISPY